MVIEAETTLAFALCGGALAADIAPVVVAEEQRNIIGHGETGVVVALYLGEDCPELGYGVGSAVNVLDNLALTIDHVVERAHILLVVTLSHSHVAVATHTDGHEVVVVLIALHALAEKLINTFLVRGIVPGTNLILALQILAVRAHHRLVVRGTHHNAHLVG